MADLLYASGHVAEATAAYKALARARGVGRARADRAGRAKRQGSAGRASGCHRRGQQERPGVARIGTLEVRCGPAQEGQRAESALGRAVLSVGGSGPGHRQRTSRTTRRAAEEGRRIGPAQQRLLAGAGQDRTSPPRISPRPRRLGRAPSVPPPATKNASASARFV